MNQNKGRFTEDLLPKSVHVEVETFNLAQRIVTTARVIKTRRVPGRGSKAKPPILEVIGRGVAICSPQDGFDPLLGRGIATGRAIKDWWQRQHLTGVEVRQLGG